MKERDVRRAPAAPSGRGRPASVEPLARTAYKGRGAVVSPPGRFERSRVVPEPSEWAPDPDDDPPRLVTIVTAETARTVISTNDSPDVPFDRSVNPYRGCEHGCVVLLRAAVARVPGALPGARLRDSDLLEAEDAPRLLPSA